MKVFAILGSHNAKGKTARAMAEQLDEYLQNGDEVTTVFADQLKINYCTSCMQCKTSEQCSQEDDMTYVLRMLHAADLVVIGSPIYFGGLSGQLKTLCDRLHPAYRGNGVSTLQGKKLILIFTQDSPSAAYADFRQLNDRYLFGFLGMKIIKTIVVGKDGRQVMLESQSTD